MNKRNFLSPLIVALFVIGQLVIAPFAVGLLMLRGILLGNTRKKAVPISSTKTSNSSSGHKQGYLSSLDQTRE
jgi:hypothetical protein